MSQFKKNSLVAALLFALPVINSYAAEPLSEGKAHALIPMQEIAVSGEYLSSNDAKADIAKKADEAGAKFYYIKAITDSTTASTGKTVYADIYASDAVKANVNEGFGLYSGVYEYPRGKAILLEPFDTVTLQGNFTSLSDSSDVAGKAAAEQGAYAFFIDEYNTLNTVGTLKAIHVQLFKQDAPVRSMIKQTILANQANYEITKEAAAKMKPFEQVVIHGSYTTPVDVSTAAAKYAQAHDAKYFYITGIESATTSDTIKVISINLYK